MSDVPLILAMASLADALSAHIRGDEGRALRKLHRVDAALQKAAEQAGQSREVVIHLHSADDRAAETAAVNAAARYAQEVGRRSPTSAHKYVPSRRT